VAAPARPTELTLYSSPTRRSRRSCRSHGRRRVLRRARLHREGGQRGLALGIRSIEHGNLLDETSVALFDRHAAFYVPTLVTYIAQLDGTTPDNVEPWQRDKISSVVDSGVPCTRTRRPGRRAHRLRTDLLGSMHARQSEEFALRTRVQKPDAVLRSATTVAAALLRREGELGVLTPGAYGDVVLARANPLDDIAALADPAHGIAHVVQAGICRS